MIDPPVSSEADAAHDSALSKFVCHFVLQPLRVATLQRELIVLRWEVVVVVEQVCALVDDDCVGDRRFVRDGQLFWVRLPVRRDKDDGPMLRQARRNGVPVMAGWMLEIEKRGWASVRWALA